MDCERLISRLFTYRTFPTLSNVSPSMLASAGFRYLGVGDTVECCLCRTVVKHLQSFSDLMAKHQSASPACHVFEQICAVAGSAGSEHLVKCLDKVKKRLVNREPGESVLRSAAHWLSRQRGVNRKLLPGIPCQTSTPNSPVNTQSNGHSTFASESESMRPLLDANRYEVNARMDLPIVRIVQDMGYSQSLIREVIAQHLAVGKELSSAQSLVEAIFILQQLNADESSEAETPAKSVHTSAQENEVNNDVHRWIAADDSVHEECSCGDGTLDEHCPSNGAPWEADVCWCCKDRLILCLSFRSPGVDAEEHQYSAKNTGMHSVDVNKKVKRKKNSREIKIRDIKEVAEHPIDSYDVMEVG